MHCNMKVSLSTPRPRLDVNFYKTVLNKPLYNEVLSITNDFLYPSDSKIYGKGPQYNKALLKQTNFASPLALSYIEGPLLIRLILSRSLVGFMR